jgi:hypothetical protein
VLDRIYSKKNISLYTIDLTSFDHQQCFGTDGTVEDFTVKDFDHLESVNKNYIDWQLNHLILEIQAFL